MTSRDQLQYIVLSDLHLGEEGSLFTPREAGNYELIYALSDCLYDLLGHFEQEDLSKFVLNGDILGLSFSSYRGSLGIFEQFLSAFTQHHRICDTIIYVPGNHDHHIWNLAKEAHFLQEMKKRKKNDEIPCIASVTEPLLSKGFETEFFDIFSRTSSDEATDIRVFYPNYLAPPNKDGEPYVLFHHGHYSEDTYHFITKAMRAFYPEMKAPATLQSLEAENGPWIDFSFSELGRSGEAGKYFEQLMATLSSKELLQKNVDELAENIANAVDFPYLPAQWMEKQLTKTLLENIANHVRSERYKGDSMCSDETVQGLMHYLNSYCHEMLKSYGWDGGDATLIWGHTHKPFEKITKTEKFEKLQLMNTGGWVLPPKATPHIGASIMLVSQKNETQALRIFNDSEDGGEMHFRISLAEGSQETPFSRSIMDYLYADAKTLNPVWTTFKKLLQKEIRQRRNTLHG